MVNTRGTENVTLDDTDLGKRNEALINENNELKKEMAFANELLTDMAKRATVTNGVQAMGVLQPEEVRKLWDPIEAAIEAFVGPMDRLIRDDIAHKNRIMMYVTDERFIVAFRDVLTTDAEIQAAAKDPMTCIIDIWTAFIWHALQYQVFSTNATTDFYKGIQRGENATYYIKNINEMEYLMTQANPPVFGRYSRRLWRRQALSAIFRTADFEWVQQKRAQTIEAVSQRILNAFHQFSLPMAEGRPLQLIRDIVTAAVRLNEHMMIEADDLWTIDMNVGDDDDFYANMQNFDLKPVGTATALRDNSPLDSIKDHLSLEAIKTRVKKLCVVRPVLRYQHIEPDGEGYSDSLDLVRPKVLVALTQIPPKNGEAAPAAPQPDELVFYTMAQNLGLIQ